MKADGCVNPHQKGRGARLHQLNNKSSIWCKSGSSPRPVTITCLRLNNNQCTEKERVHDSMNGIHFKLNFHCRIGYKTVLAVVFNRH